MAKKETTQHKEIERLRKEVERLEEHLAKLDPATDEYSKVNEAYLKIHKMINDYEKTDCEGDSKKVELWSNLGLGIAGLLLPLGFNFIWLAWGFQFEENGSIKSQVFKWLTSRFTKK